MPFLSRGWWAVVARGAIALIFGLIAIFHPMDSVRLGTLFGVFAAMVGALAVLSGIGVPFARRAGNDVSLALVLEGILGVALGAFAIAVALSPVALALVIAGFALVTGLMEMATALRVSNALAGERLLLFAGVASLAAAVVIGAFARYGATAEQWLVGLYAVLFGAILVPAGFHFRHVEDGEPEDA